MPLSHGLKVLLALGHLILVVCGAARLLPDSDRLPARTIRLYAECTGASNGYGFFAPSVASPWDVQFSIYADGEGWVEGALPDANTEVQLRARTVLGALPYESLREPITASLAAQKFSLYPRADFLNAHVRFLHIPTMTEYRAGQRPEWVTTNVYSFAHEPTPIAGE